MITNQGPRVLEFNVRLGDTETQPLLMRLRTDLVDLLEAAIDDRLDQFPEQRLEWDPRPAVCVVMASEGYPGSYQKGRLITGLDDATQVPHTKVFHAGTKLVEGRVVTDGGRVLGITALGETIRRAKEHAHEAIRQIQFAGGFYRKDIGDKASA
jgi:phosphoribosylamine--glycine ligase